MTGKTKKPRSYTSIIAIQARSSSVRLPGKVLRPICGKPMIWHIVQRAMACECVDHVVVATSNTPSDDDLVNFLEKSKIKVFRGSLDDVLGRFIALLDKYPVDFLVRVTGDCPFINPKFIDFQLNMLAKYNADIIRLEQECTVLEGQGVHSSSSLKIADTKSIHPNDREHVGSKYFLENRTIFKTIGIRVPQNFAKIPIRLAVDEQKDFDLAELLYEKLWDKKSIIPFDDLIHYLLKNPEIYEINEAVQNSQINKDILQLKKNLSEDISKWINWTG